jgi:hypothetical protein
LEFSYGVCPGVVDGPRAPIHLEKVPELPVVDLALYSKNILGMRIEVPMSMIVVLEAAVVGGGGTSGGE